MKQCPCCKQPLPKPQRIEISEDRLHELCELQANAILKRVSYTVPKYDNLFGEYEDWQGRVQEFDVIPDAQR